MIHSLETPVKMAHYLTDNRRLQAHLLQFFSIKDDVERKNFDDNFWKNCEELPEQEQFDLKEAKSHIAQRLLDRTGSLLHFIKEEFVAQTA